MQCRHIIAVRNPNRSLQDTIIAPRRARSVNRNVGEGDGILEGGVSFQAGPRGAKAFPRLAKKGASSVNLLPIPLIVVILIGLRRVQYVRPREEAHEMSTRRLAAVLVMYL